MIDGQGSSRVPGIRQDSREAVAKRPAVAIRFALFDQAYRAGAGTYWTWHAPDLAPALLDDFFYNVASSRRPQDPNRLRIDELHGGCAVLEGWCCWYRFVDGGRDRQNRPGRYVLVCAFLDQDDVEGHDGSGILWAPEFEEVARVAPAKCPVPPPAKLTRNGSLPPASKAAYPSLKLRHDRDLHFLTDRSGALKVAGAFAAFLPAGGRGYCQLDNHHGRQQVHVHVDRLPEPEPMPVEVPVSNSEPSGRIPGGEVVHDSLTAVEAKFASFWSKRSLRERFSLATLALMVPFILGAAVGIWIGTGVHTPPSLPDRPAIAAPREGPATGKAGVSVGTDEESGASEGTSGAGAPDEPDEAEGVR